MTQASARKPLRHPRAWAALWWLAIAVTVAVCLLPAPDLPRVRPGFDKVEHFVAFFLLAASAVQLYASRRALWCTAAGLVTLGVVIELLQGALTTTRAADPRDALADALGVLVGMAIALTPLRDLLLRIDGRRG